MGTYKIAPDTTGEIGMAQMKRGLVAKADYDNSQGVTTEINMQTLVVNSTTYQGDLTSKTWDTSQPYGFGEMYGETWNDQTPFTIFIYGTPVSSNCSKFTGTVKKNGTVVATITKNSNSTTTGLTSFSVVDTDTILMEVEAFGPTGAGCASYSETTVNLQTGNSAFSQTTRSSVTSGVGGSTSYSFTASTSEAYINFNHVPVA
jgi:hypothetical protein